MSHAHETATLWRRLGETEEVFVKWSTFFRAMAGRPQEAAELCELGLKIVRGEEMSCVEIRGSVERILEGPKGGA